MPKLKSSDLTRLDNCVRTSSQSYERYLRNRRQYVRRFVGHRHYGGTESPRVPIPLIELFITTLMNELASDNPRVLITTPDRLLKPAAAELESTVNAVIQRINLLQTLQNIIVDSLFGGAYACVGVSDGYSSADGLNYGKHFIDRIDPEDYLIDMSSSSREDAQFESYAIEVNVEDAIANELVRRKDAELHGRQYSMSDGYYGRLIGTLTSQREMIEHFKDILRIHAVWLPYEGLVATTFSTEDGLPDFSEKPISVVDWRGPPRGPIHQLGYYAVPGSPIPLAPVSPLIDLADYCNKMFLKAEDDSLNEKTNFAAQPGQEQDTKRLKRAGNLEIIEMSNPEQMQTLTSGGAKPGQVAMLQLAKDLFSYFAGNLDVMAGLGPQSETATQDAMLQGASGKRISAMSKRVYEFVSGLLGKDGLSHYLWNDPLINETSTKRFNDTGVVMKYEFTPERRKGKLDDYDIDIEPYSLQYRSPQQKLSTVTQTMQNAIFPVLPFAQDQNVTLDLPAYIEMIGRLQNLESEYADILTFKDRSSLPQQQQGQQMELPAAPMSQRTYIRRSVGGGYRGSGRANANDQMIRKFMSGMK